jgi:hypothetical protein
MLIEAKKAVTGHRAKKLPVLTKLFDSPQKSDQSLRDAN